MDKCSLDYKVRSGTFRVYKTIDVLYICMHGLDHKVRSGHVLCYHDHLRRDDHRRQGTAVIEGMARYGHQGGGQRQAGQGKVT